jgi:hypothetical protein
MPVRPWTDAEREEARRLFRKEGKTKREIAAAFSHSWSSTDNMLRGRYTASSHRENYGPIIPERVQADARLRASLAPRDLTAAYQGDPLPGYSALDRLTREVR